MSKIVFIKQNSPEIREKLKDAGYSLCICADFKDSVWLEHHPDDEYYKDFHGVGYVDDIEDDYIKSLSPEKRIKLWLTWDRYFSEEREFYDNVEDFLAVYPKPKRD